MFASIVILIGFKISNTFNTQIQANVDMPATSKAASAELNNDFSGVVDNSFLFLMVGIGIVTLAMASLVRVHPIFLVFFIIGLIFIIFLSAVFSNIYDKMASDPQLSVEASQLDNITFIINKLPFFVGVFGILLMVVMYKVWGNE